MLLAKHQESFFWDFTFFMVFYFFQKQGNTQQHITTNTYTYDTYTQTLLHVIVQRVAKHAQQAASLEQFTVHTATSRPFGVQSVKLAFIANPELI